MEEIILDSEYWFAMALDLQKAVKTKSVRSGAFLTPLMMLLEEAAD